MSDQDTEYSKTVVGFDAAELYRSTLELRSRRLPQHVIVENNCLALTFFVGKSEHKETGEPADVVLLFYIETGVSAEELYLKLGGRPRTDGGMRRFLGNLLKSGLYPTSVKLLIFPDSIEGLRAALKERLISLGVDSEEILAKVDELIVKGGKEVG